MKNAETLKGLAGLALPRAALNDAGCICGKKAFLMFQANSFGPSMGISFVVVD